MRVNVYAEEMTDRVEIISKVIDGITFTGLRFYLELPVTVKDPRAEGVKVYVEGGEMEDYGVTQIRGPFMHSPDDDDSAAVTFWGKSDLREMLSIAGDKLGEHYGSRYHHRPRRPAGKVMRHDGEEVRQASEAVDVKAEAQAVGSSPPVVVTRLGALLQLFGDMAHDGERHAALAYLDTYYRGGK